MNMNTVTVVMNIGRGPISFCINKHYLDRLITNIQLFHKDVKFVDLYIDDYAESVCSQFIPTQNGILFIDFESDTILDSQKVSAINKITPVELRMSMNGTIPEETHHNNLFLRFKSLFEDGRLTGFERWQDNGNHINRDITKYTFDQLLEIYTKSSDYGQFVFDTSPFKVEYFSQKDYVEQTKLFNKAVSLNLLPTETHNTWKNHLEALK